MFSTHPIEYITGTTLDPLSCPLCLQRSQLRFAILIEIVSDRSCEMRDDGGDITVLILHDYSSLIFITWFMVPEIVYFSLKVVVVSQYELLDPITDNHACHRLWHKGSRTADTATSTSMIAVISHYM